MALQAFQDSKGNSIETTYATKEELQNSQMVMVEPYLKDYAKIADIEDQYAKATEVVKKSELAAEVSNLKSATADKLSNAKKITLTGAVKGTVNFDGSENAEIEVEFSEGTAITAAELAAIFYL